MIYDINQKDNSEQYQGVFENFLDIYEFQIDLLENERKFTEACVQSDVYEVLFEQLGIIQEGVISSIVEGLKKFIKGVFQSIRNFFAKIKNFIMSKSSNKNEVEKSPHVEKSIDKIDGKIKELEKENDPKAKQQIKELEKSKTELTKLTKVRPSEYIKKYGDKVNLKCNFYNVDSVATLLKYDNALLDAKLTSAVTMTCQDLTDVVYSADNKTEDEIRKSLDKAKSPLNKFLDDLNSNISVDEAFDKDYEHIIEYTLKTYNELRIGIKVSDISSVIAKAEANAKKQEAELLKYVSKFDKIEEYVIELNNRSKEYYNKDLKDYGRGETTKVNVDNTKKILENRQTAASIIVPYVKNIVADIKTAISKETSYYPKYLGKYAKEYAKFDSENKRLREEFEQACFDMFMEDKDSKLVL